MCLFSRKSKSIPNPFKAKEGKVGRGKMRWEELNDEEAKREAREDTGLGASQTAEVAYLETWTYLSICLKPELVIGSTAGLIVPFS